MVDLIMLVGASIGSVAFSILAAYGILRVGFALMRPQRRTAATSVRPQVARAS
jgi:ABC-type glycerol-3-phosphate transport system permease component